MSLCVCFFVSSSHVLSCEQGLPVLAMLKIEDGAVLLKVKSCSEGHAAALVANVQEALGLNDA